MVNLDKPLFFKEDIDSLPSKKSEAISLGLKWFYTGRFCKNGHLDIRYVNGGCRGCHAERRKKHRAKPSVRERELAYAREYSRTRPKPVKERIYLPEYEGFPETRKGAISLGTRRYFTGKACKSGHLEQRDIKHGCMGCRREKESAREKTPEGRAKKRAARGRRRKTDAGRAAESARKRRRLERIKSDPALLATYREKQRERRRRYALTPGGRAYRRRQSFNKEIRVRQATPKWVNRSLLREFIGSCPPDCHIDHILPLRGKTVCGLNVLENLQYLPARENILKSNKVGPLTLEYCVCPIRTE